MKVINRANSYQVLGTYPAHFEETKGINTSRTSRERSDIDEITIYIPKVLREIDMEDIIIRNPNQNPIPALKSLSEYKKQYEAYTVTSSDVMDFGSPHMRHTVVGGK